MDIQKIATYGTAVAVAGGGGGGAGAGAGSNGTAGINTNSATSNSPATLGELLRGCPYVRFRQEEG